MTLNIVSWSLLTVILCHALLSPCLCYCHFLCLSYPLPLAMFQSSLFTMHYNCVETFGEGFSGFFVSVELNPSFQLGQIYSSSSVWWSPGRLGQSQPDKWGLIWAKPAGWEAHAKTFTTTNLSPQRHHYTSRSALLSVLPHAPLQTSIGDRLTYNSNHLAS